MFQPMYAGENGSLWYLTVMPEWYLVTIALCGFSLLGLFWAPLLWVCLPLLLVAAAVPLAHVCASAAGARFSREPIGRWRRLMLYLRTASLHVLQPMARLVGRVGYKLTPWRQHGAAGMTLPWARTVTCWPRHVFVSYMGKIRLSSGTVIVMSLIITIASHWKTRA